MRTAFVIAAGLGASLVGAPALEAQRGPSSPIVITRGEFAISPFAGYLVSQSFIEGPLNTRVGSVNAPLFGAQASLPLAPNASLIGTIGYSSGDLEVGAPILGGVSIGDSDTWVFDASVELRAPSFGAGRFVPFAHLGGGALHRRLGVLGITADATDFMVSGGLGADIPISSSMAIRLLAKDHYGKADFGSLGSLEAKTNDLHTLALSAGLRIAF
ncbi:MAG: hypothetical protein ACRENP_05155 [Longimicrobiales bacterium]